MGCCGALTYCITAPPPVMGIKSKEVWIGRIGLGKVDISRALGGRQSRRRRKEKGRKDMREAQE